MQALPEQGKLIACDRDPRALQLAQTAFSKAGIAHKVSTHLLRCLQHNVDVVNPASTWQLYWFHTNACTLCSLDRAAAGGDQAGLGQRHIAQLAGAK